MAEKKMATIAYYRANQQERNKAWRERRIQIIGATTAIIIPGTRQEIAFGRKLGDADQVRCKDGRVRDRFIR